MPSSAPRPAGSVADEMARRERLGEIRGLDDGRKNGHAEATAALSGMMTDVALELQALRTAVKDARIVLRDAVDEYASGKVSTQALGESCEDALGILERCERR